MGSVIGAIRRFHGRSIRWFRIDEPVAYRDAWRYSLLYGLILSTFTIAYAAMGSSIWPFFLSLIVPTMATFTFGVAVRSGTLDKRLLSVAVGALGATPLMIPTVRGQIQFFLIGGPGILLVWFVMIVGLMGYAFPELV